MLSEIDVTNSLHRIHSNTFFSKNGEKCGLRPIYIVEYIQYEYSPSFQTFVLPCAALQSSNISRVFLVLKMQFISGWQKSSSVVYSLQIGVFFCQCLSIVARYWIFWVYTIYHKWLFYLTKKVVINLTHLEILT